MDSIQSSQKSRRKIVFLHRIRRGGTPLGLSSSLADLAISDSRGDLMKYQSKEGHTKMAINCSLHQA